MVVGEPRDEREETTLGILPSELMAAKCKMPLHFTNRNSRIIFITRVSTSLMRKFLSLN